MRKLASQFGAYLYRRKLGNVQSRNFSSSNYGKDDRSIEEEAERKIGWFLKLIFAGTATIVGYQFFPYMGDNLMQQSVSLLKVKDPLFKRMGASRLSRFAIDDERRMKIVEMGGVEELLNMLVAAKDDRTRKEALKALAALCPSGPLLMKQLDIYMELEQSQLLGLSLSSWRMLKLGNTS
ncbi:uncharacterized protein LOC127797553 isoform X2 [Diospyros lotus]|uniref:uncharacterized protein LOC127797553 isoform X2 n=1 Tax=Diospyros lotus TaxID=55363 RepID=UPI00224DA102|nr:uncharacterized protein LOC127797553 isoform X2 [Diospyros lotus]